MVTLQSATTTWCWRNRTIKPGAFQKCRSLCDRFVAWSGSTTPGFAADFGVSAAPGRPHVTPRPLQSISRIDPVRDAAPSDPAKAGRYGSHFNVRPAGTGDEGCSRLPAGGPGVHGVVAAFSGSATHRRHVRPWFGLEADGSGTQITRTPARALLEYCPPQHPALMSFDYFCLPIVCIFGQDHLCPIIPASLNDEWMLCCDRKLYLRRYPLAYRPVR